MFGLLFRKGEGDFRILMKILFLSKIFVMSFGKTLAYHRQLKMTVKPLYKATLMYNTHIGIAVGSIGIKLL